MLPCAGQAPCTHPQHHTDRQGMASERACDAECGRTLPTGDPHEAGPDVWLCDDCWDNCQYDYLIPERQPRGAP